MSFADPSNSAESGDPSNPVHPRRCTARRTDGEPCGRWAIAGGVVCPSHGGATGRAKAAAERRVATASARAIAQSLGVAIETDPHRALLDEVHRAAGVVAWLGSQVAALDRTAVTFGVTKTVEGGPQGGTTERRAAVNIWVQLYGEERDRLVRAAKAALDAGVEERRVELAEHTGLMIVEMITSVLNNIDLTNEQRRSADKAIATQLRLVAPDPDIGESS